MHALCALAVVCSQCEAKVFTRWVCLIEAESGRNTGAVVSRPGTRHWDWGLFQISEQYWCSTGASPGKDCNVRCLDLIMDDITKASNCAKLIYRRHNFNAWYGWLNKCRGQALPDISNC